MNLTEEMQAVVANLREREWIQGEMRNGESVCAHGAVQTCQGLRPGDEHIIRAVMRTKGVTEEWNDKSGRTKDEVLARMAFIEVSDVDLEETFGPAWRMVIAVIRRSAILTPTEVTDLAAAWSAAGGAARGAAWSAAWSAAGGAARGAAWSAAWSAARGAAGGAAWSAARGAAWSAAWGAAWSAARGAVVSDLVGQRGLTQDHLDTLMGPWVRVLGADWAEGVES